jgi:hypothetical protein
MIQRLRPWLIRMYPRSWRIRYEAEFNALLEQSLYSPLDVLDILLGALDAHVLLLSGENLTWRGLNMLNKVRTAILIVFAAYIGFVIAGFGLVGMADDSPMIALTKTTPALAAAWITIQAGSGIALLAVVVGGLPLAFVVIRQALSKSHQGLGLLLVPVLAFLVLVAYAAFVLAVGTGRIALTGVVPVVQPGPFPPGNRLLLAGLMVTFIVGAIASTLAVWKVVCRTDVEQESFRAVKRSITIKVYQFAYWPAVVATAAMFVMLAATLTWAWLAFAALPGALAGNEGPWGISTQTWFIGVTVLMTLCTTAAGLGVWRGRYKALAD